MAEISKPIFVLPIDLGTMVCDSADTGHPVFNLAEFKAPGTTWKAAATGDHWIRGYWSSAETIDFLAIMAANADADTKYRLRLGTSQAEVDGGSAPYDSGELDFIGTAPVVAPDDGLYHSHLELPAAETATWWRIDLVDHPTKVEASMIVMGSKVQPSRFYNLDYEQGVEDLGEMQIGRWGVLDETDGAVWRTLDFSLAWITEAEFETSFRPLMKALGGRGVVYCCFDPTDSSYRHARTYMGMLRKSLFARGVKKPRTFQQDFSLRSFF
jgi:hypothetical protein